MQSIRWLCLAFLFDLCSYSDVPVGVSVTVLVGVSVSVTVAVDVGVCVGV